MKQHLMRGFGSPYLTGAKPPANMPPDVVALCRSEADAVALAIDYARARFGYSQEDVARLCGWKRGNHLSTYKTGKAPLTDDPKRWDRFAQVTGCNLLEQYRECERAKAGGGPLTENARSRLIVARMLRAAA